MNATFELVKRAIGNPDLSPSTTQPYGDSPYFDIYDVDLPLPEFSGIPRRWMFIVLDSLRAKLTESSRDAVLADASTIIGNLPKTRLLVLLSNDPSMHMGDEFGSVRREVFCLDQTELPQGREYSARPRFAPFVLAIQRRVNITPILARAFSPYQRNTPASGWRFFGREKQLKTIIDGSENLVLVGARRVGKTSLLLEAERRLREEGKTVYYADVQNCTSASEVVNELLRVVSPKDAARALRHREVFHESVWSNLIRGLATGSGKTVLLIDELGNVLANLPKDQWTFMGVLRKYAARDGLKFVISCFQELFFRQQTEFEGPLVNFAHTLRLSVFSRKEVEEFLIAPLEFWKPLGSARNDLLDLVISNVGSHPYFLQFFCRELFERFTDERHFNPILQAQSLLKKDLHEWFPGAVDEVFFRIPSSTVQYLFLRRCQTADDAGQALSNAEFTDDWIEWALRDMGYRSNMRGRRNLLDSLEMHGLCVAIDHDRAKRVIAAPLIYPYVRQTVEVFDTWLAKLGKETEREREVWELQK